MVAGAPVMEAPEVAALVEAATAAVVVPEAAVARAEEAADSLTAPLKTSVTCV